MLRRKNSRISGIKLYLGLGFVVIAVEVVVVGRLALVEFVGFVDSFGKDCTCILEYEFDFVGLAFFGIDGSCCLLFVL